MRTEEARLAAENAVAAVYASPDPSIARSQIERLRTALQYIALVREDQNSTPEQKAADIASLNDVTLKPETIEKILALPSARWDTIQQEALSVLEQVMRRSIRDQDAGIHPAHDSIPGKPGIERGAGRDRVGTGDGLRHTQQPVQRRV